MIPEIKIKDFYLNYINNARTIVAECNGKMEYIKEFKEVLLNYLNKNKHKLLETYNIDLDTYIDEWVNSKYNEGEKLYQRVIKIVKFGTEENRETVLQLLKYCNVLKQENNILDKLNYNTEKMNLPYHSYIQYVNNYYREVQKVVLEGKGYTFNYGIGMLLINYWKLNNPDRKYVDFNETNRVKKELLEKGATLYDKKEAVKCKRFDVPYDGVEYKRYVVYKQYYEITIINSRIAATKNLDLQISNTIPREYKGMTYADVAQQLCNTLEDVYNLRYGLRGKLAVLVIKFPEKYLNFIRNADSQKYECRKNNC